MSEDHKGSSPKHDRVVDLYFQTLHIENISHAPSFPEWKYIPFAPKGGNIQSRTSKFRFPYRCQSVLALSPNINPILCPPIISSLQDNFFLPHILKSRRQNYPDTPIICIVYTHKSPGLSINHCSVFSKYTKQCLIDNRGKIPV